MKTITREPSAVQAEESTQTKKRGKLTVSVSPHLRSPETTTGIMLDVVIALVPSLIAAVCIFGWRALLLTCVSVGTCVLCEYLCRKVMKRDNTISDLSAVVTGILLAFNLPVTLPLWMVVIGAIVAIVVVKQFFGGIGQNFVNPALTGRIVLMMSFPAAMSNWVVPFVWKNSAAITTATPMAQLGDLYSNFGSLSATPNLLLENASLPSMMEMLLGVRSGSLGEVCALTLILGGLYLMIRRVISPAIPLVYVGTVACVMLIAWRGNLEFVAYELLGGGLLLGAVFMATDYTTSPINFKGKLVFAVGCGLITSLIRLFGNMPEGVSFSILFMNILVPHIERLTTPRPFGSKRKKKKAEKKEAQAS